MSFVPGEPWRLSGPSAAVKEEELPAAPWLQAGRLTGGQAGRLGGW